MFIPNRNGSLARSTGYDFHAQPSFGRDEDVRYASIHINQILSSTTVRADSSASRGAADEIVAKATVLFPAKVEPNVNDRFRDRDFPQLFRVTKVEPRYNVAGQIDHWQCDLEPFEVEA
ncbi:hypothetical protein [Aureimonas sp. AU40]|uniref:hypothetical protein n=1 Tax=Aureimonas sp. AU40 TaxID=1637747 RepID=UPI0007806243|nr:hypothetical protein [Aureimonas sp. AU40]